MHKWALYVFCYILLPVVLSEPADPRTAYAVEGSNGEIIANEIVLLRSKRQVSVSLPNTPSTAVVQKLNSSLGTIWMNKTQNPKPKNDGEKTPLLRDPSTRFETNNNGAKTTAGTQILLGNETAYSNSSEPSQLPDFPMSPSEWGKQQNVTKNMTEQEENYQYYKVNKIPAPEGLKYWIDLESNNGTKHEMLSDAHRRAATIAPFFNFTFYGHRIMNITIATGGFIFLGDQVHAWLAATQYVAPLMGNFDTSNSPNSTINYLNTKDFFTVEWNQIKLRSSNKTDFQGSFTFQTTLYKNGTIVFVYKDIPIAISSIEDTDHPVKVGLSDAYIRDRSLLVIKQKTIYEYHRVDLKDTAITNGSAIIFTLQNTCLNFTSCEECTSDDVTDFECSWCPKLRRCSSGLDRHRQEWVTNGCDKDYGAISHPLQCNGPAVTLSTLNYSSFSSTSNPRVLGDLFDDHNNEAEHAHTRESSPETSQVQRVKTDSGGTSAGGVLAIMFFTIILFSAVGWFAYAYFYPHTPSGQLLIRYRPSRWMQFRRGEARYTAASIHM